ncbi:hypothetical protein LG290_06365 [Halomonas sediminis]
MAEKETSKRVVTAVKEEYELEVKSFEVRMSAGVNVTPDSGCSFISLDDPLYDAHLQLEIMSTCLGPARFKGDDCKVIMFTYDRNDWSELCVADVQNEDEHMSPKYLKRGRSAIPDFEPPHGIGEVWRSRRIDPWMAPIGVPFFVVQEFRTALSRGQAPRLFLEVRRTGRERLIQRVAYSTPGLFEG